MTLTHQILSEHLIDGQLVPGEEVQLRVDQALLQDATGTMACLQLEQLAQPGPSPSGEEDVGPALRQFEAFGFDRIRLPSAIVYVDHNVLALDFKNPDDHRFLQGFCARYGLHYSQPGNGICHYLHVERFARPGEVLVGADSHTTTSGALGMVAIGAGGLEVACVLGGYPFPLETPWIVGVRLEGELSPWVQAKDVVLEILRRRGVRGGRGAIFEFYGPGAATLRVTERATICNMIVETGATTGLFPSDERTREWLRYQRREDHWVERAAEPGARYDEDEVIELDRLEPLIATPGSPGNVLPVRGVAGREVRQVCVGSSVNSGYEDLAIVAAVLRGKTVHPRVSLTVTPGSRQILDTLVATSTYRDLIAAGARMLEPACGPCVGMGQAPATGTISVRTFNRNFPGRSGTENDQVYLASPATAAAAALTGVITDPRDLGEAPRIAPPLANPAIDDRNILPPPPPEEAARIEIVRGPNIQSPPAQSPLRESLRGRVLIVLPDDISTGDLAPDGAIVMAFRSNVAAISRYTLRRFDRGFAERAHAWGGGFIVAGHNYGQGSSREHAALAPKFLGVTAVVARSFARIHRRNLITQGIVPLVFTGEEDLGRARQGDTWEISDVRRALESGAERLFVRVRETDARFTVLGRFSSREREVLLAGGLIAWLQGGGLVPMSVHRGASGLVDQGSLVTNPIPQDQVDGS
ncbi:MAG: aconitate hydratase [Candidatus Rokubacteria bacterium]|nr:aconitate hydratase [Candidatus Rokubacteria bacterium]